MSNNGFRPPSNTRKPQNMTSNPERAPLAYLVILPIQEGDHAHKRARTDDFSLYILGPRLIIEPNTSYTRNLGLNPNISGLSGPQRTWNNSNTLPLPLPLLSVGLPANSALKSQPTAPGQTAEDKRFLRLAEEALVATAGAKGLGHDLMVDPTIQDLLRRLQYASSPHGNPIKRGKKIHANENGQLQIQGFYKQFPDLSNNIFMDPEGNELGHETSHPAAFEGSASASEQQRKSSLSRGREDWNFLVGGALEYRTAPQALGSRLNEERAADDHEDVAEADAEDGEGSRKFTCKKCFMSFRRSSDLKRHEKQHLTVPPNICERCGKGFARKDALKRHVGTLTCKRNADRKLYVENLNYVGKDNRNYTQSAGHDWLV